jgi:hypothetical protein
MIKPRLGVYFFSEVSNHKKIGVVRKDFKVALDIDRLHQSVTTVADRDARGNKNS